MLDEFSDTSNVSSNELNTEENSDVDSDIMANNNKRQPIPKDTSYMSISNGIYYLIYIL